MYITLDLDTERTMEIIVLNQNEYRSQNEFCHLNNGRLHPAEVFCRSTGTKSEASRTACRF
jgi:hypothetical protein